MKKLDESTSLECINPVYLELSNAYFASEFNEIQKPLKDLALSCPYNTRYPILKLLKSVCACLLINELECIFFAYVIETNGWKINDQIIKKHKNEVKEIIFYASTISDEYKSLTLYLLLCGYTSKFYLNECTDIFAAELEKICPDFKGTFSQWVKQEAHTTLKINPQSLNKVYKRMFLSKKPTGTNFDYNSLVDDVLMICPSYNPQEREKYMEMQKQKKLLKSTHQHPLCISNTIPNLSILTSSGFLQQLGINPANNSLILTESIQPINKKHSFGLNSSQFGLNSIAPPDDQNDIVDFHIGFRECHSDHQDNAPMKQSEQGTPKSSSKQQPPPTNTSTYLY